MGGQNSKIATGGSLQGAFAPSIAEVPEENLPSMNKPTSYRAIVPQTVRGVSDGFATMSCTINGATKMLKIPEGLKKGDSFTFKHTRPEYEKVFTSTLPMVPGMEIVQAKPIIWGSVSHSFSRGSYNQQVMGKKVGQLMQEAQAKILEQVLEHRCNACLGMAFNVTNDSSGERGNQKLVIVTACGTPCVVVPTTTALAIDASVMAEPLYE